MREFTMVIERDPEGGWYVGEVVGLPGCHTQASDVSTLETNMREAIEVYLETVEIDDDVPEYVGVRQIAIPARRDCRLPITNSGRGWPSAPASSGCAEKQP